MDPITRENREWLEHRFTVGAAQGAYYAHEPIYGVGCALSEPFQARRLARAYSVLRRLAQMPFESLLDIGGAEGYYADLARKLLGVGCVTSDLSFEANLRARELFDVPAVACEGASLPFEDESFDIVTCCEVREHVTDPVAVMAEALRVARRYVVFTAEEICWFEGERRLRLALARTQRHAERNVFRPEDFRTVFGNDATIERQGIITSRCAWLEAIREEPDAAEVKDLLLQMTRTGAPDTRSLETEFGILVIKGKEGAAPLSTSRAGDEALLDAMLAEKMSPNQSPPFTAEVMHPFLRALLACPACRRLVTETPSGLRCPACQRVFRVERGIPLMYLEQEAQDSTRRDRSRWPWLSDEARQLRTFFRAPRRALGFAVRHMIRAGIGWHRLRNRLHQGGWAEAAYRTCKRLALRIRAANYRRHKAIHSA